MTLGQKRRKFSQMISILVLATPGLIRRGEICYDDVKARDGHIKGSFHYNGLAADMNLYIRGRYQRDTEAHLPLGEFWESLGGSWGGHWGDGNHYSLGEGRKGDSKNERR